MAWKTSLIKVPAVEECDATGDDTCDIAGYKKLHFIKL